MFLLALVQKKMEKHVLVCFPLSQSSAFCLLNQVVNLFNMFITYGDTFLPTSNSYDELYYEIVRMHQVFDNLYCMGQSPQHHLHVYQESS